VTLALAPEGGRIEITFTNFDGDVPHSLMVLPTSRAKTICRSRQGGDRPPCDDLFQVPETGDRGRSLHVASAREGSFGVKYCLPGHLAAMSAA
jgi:hypothetical protein